MFEPPPPKMLIEDLEKILNYIPGDPLYMNFGIYGFSVVDISTIEKQLEKNIGITKVCLQPDASLPLRIDNPSKEDVLRVYREELNMPNGELTKEHLERPLIHLGKVVWNIESYNIELKHNDITLNYYDEVPAYFYLMMKELKEARIGFGIHKIIPPSFEYEKVPEKSKP